MAWDFPNSPTTGQTFTPAGGPTYVWNGYAWATGAVAGRPPTVQTFLSGSGTYVSPPGVVWLDVLCVGGGAGGGGATGNGATPPGGTGTAGGNTTFGSLTAGGGGISTYSGPGTPGTGSGGNVFNLTGGSGNAVINTAAVISPPGGIAGNSILSGGGAAYLNAAGGNAAANTGSGGAGGGYGLGITSGTYGGCGGSAGGAVRNIFTSPAATYAYVVGAAGVGGAAGGANAYAGGNGAAGIIIVTEYYPGGGGVGATAPNIKVFTASGTYTPSANLIGAIIECVGGGGAGAGITGASGYVAGAGGGGSGGYSRVFKTAAQIGASQLITIGAGGVPGAAGSAAPGPLSQADPLVFPARGDPSPGRLRGGTVHRVRRVLPAV